MPITENQHEFAKDVYNKLRQRGFRVELDSRSESIGTKIKDARNQRIQYMLVIGEREVEAGAIAVRSRREGQLGAISVDETIAKLEEDIAKKI
jgi:threonyl-tRNA synthetase